MIALDTNLFVYAHRELAPENRAAREAIARAAGDPRGFGFSLPVVGEFWAVVTRKNPPSTAEEASRFFRELTRAGAVVWTPTAGFPTRLVRRAAELSARGTRVFDLQIGLLALEGGAEEIWTADRGFLAPPELPILDPIEQR